MPDKENRDNKPNKQLLTRIIVLNIIIAVIFSVSLAAIILSRPGSGSSISGGYTATVYQNGRVISVIELSAAEDSSFTVRTEQGGTNTITVKDGDICVSEASCPDKLCVKEGWGTKSPVPIVCLPNRLVIVISDNTAHGGEYDALTY